MIANQMNMNTEYFVDAADPRLVPGEQAIVRLLRSSGICKPGIYICGPGTAHEAITFDFALQAQYLVAPHPVATSPSSIIAPPPGPRVLKIKDCEKTDPSRGAFTIELYVALHDRRQERPVSDAPAEQNAGVTKSDEEDHWETL